MHCITILCSLLTADLHSGVLGQSDGHVVVVSPVTVYHAVQEQYWVPASCTGVGAAAWGPPHHPHCGCG